MALSTFTMLASTTSLWSGRHFHYPAGKPAPNKQPTPSPQFSLLQPQANTKPPPLLSVARDMPALDTSYSMWSPVSAPFIELVSEAHPAAACASYFLPLYGACSLLRLFLSLGIMPLRFIRLPDA